MARLLLSSGNAWDGWLPGALACTGPARAPPLSVPGAPTESRVRGEGIASLAGIAELDPSGRAGGTRAFIPACRVRCDPRPDRGGGPGRELGVVRQRPAEPPHGPLLPAVGRQRTT